MANKRLDYDKIYELVMQCRRSGLSDRQWCLDNDIVPSTFYYWVRRLRQHACYDLPETECSGRNVSAAEKQDVVCVNIQPDPVRETAEFRLSTYRRLQTLCFSMAASASHCQMTLKNRL